MLTIIEKSGRIREAQAQLKRNLNACSEKKGPITIGGQWGNQRQLVSWSSKLSIWWTTYSLSNRFENAFGIEKPRWDTKYGYAIPSVIDIPFSGINRRIGGAFAVDENNRVYLLHRGRIGGGRKGIGKTLFLENYRGEWETVQDGDSVSKLAMVAALSSRRFPHQIASFVYEVQRIKKEGKIETESRVPFTDTFKEGFSGTKEYVVGRVEAECDHELVVSSLEKLLRLTGLVLGNRYPMDLYVLDSSKRISTIFEVKTDSTSTSCYKAIGQLLFYSAKLDRRPQLIAVFPNTFDKQHTFDRIGIQCLTYRWRRNQPEFDDSHIANLEIT